MITYGYDHDTSTCRLYNRDAANEVGFQTVQLSAGAAHRLRLYCEKLYRDGIERGRQEVAAAVRAALPPDQTTRDA